MIPRRWRLDDVEVTSARYPRSFFIPSLRVRRTLRKNDLAKLVFLSTIGRPWGERMWVIVDTTRGGHYRGRLSNQPGDAPLRYGQSVSFGPENVCAVERHRGRDMSAFGRRKARRP